MKLLNAIQQNAAQITLPRAVQINAQAFSQMWSRNDATRRVSNPELLNRVIDDWQKHLGGKHSVEIAEVFVDKQHLQYLDIETKQLQAMTDADLLDLDVARLVAGRAIIKLKATDFDDEIAPSLAIHITERGEQFSYGALVGVCTNFTVMNADYHFDTYKAINKLQQGKKWTMQDVMQFFNQNILPNTVQNFELDMQHIEYLKEQQVHLGAFNRFVGELFSKIEYINHHRIARTIRNIEDDMKRLPINGRQLSQIVVEAQQPAHRVYDWQNDTTTAWNIVNYGTEILKFKHGSDVNTLLETNSNWIETVRNYDFSTN
jgi:hypothetical protein